MGEGRTREAATQGGRRDSNLIDLGLGHPGSDMLPLELVRRAARTRLETADASLLQYGLEQGDPALRERIAGFSGGRPENIYITAGASQALDLLCTLFTRPGDTVLTAQPTYHLALRIFADHGLEVVGVESDEEGPDPDALERLLGAHAPRLLYLVTPFANPSGTTVSGSRLEALAGLAREHDCWLVTDEVYRLLAFDGAGEEGSGHGAGAEDAGYSAGHSAGRHADADAGRYAGPAISLHSFSKILAPGLRLGWIEAPAEVMSRIEGGGLAMSGGGLNPFVGAVVDELLESGAFDGHLNGLRATLRTRAAALVAALERHLPGAVFARPAGGYFVWLRLPGVDTGELLPVANAAGVNYQPGSRFSHGPECVDRMRLSFSHYPPELLDTAVRRLAGALQSTSPAIERSS